MENKVNTTTELFHVEVEPSSTIKGKGADTIEMQISPSNVSEGELIVRLRYRKLNSLIRSYHIAVGKSFHRFHK